MHVWRFRGRSIESRGKRRDMKCTCCRYLNHKMIIFPDIFVCDKCDKSQKGRDVAAYYFSIHNMRMVRYVIIPMMVLYSFISSEIQWVPIAVNVILGFFIIPRFIKVRLPDREDVLDEILIANLTD